MFLVLLIAVILAAESASAEQITDGMTRSEKINILSKYFDPSPSQKPLIDFNSKRNKKIGYKKAKGYIKVLPPKGKCFNISVSKKKNERRICKPSRLYFDVSQLKKDGTFTWVIKTAPNDFDITALIKYSPYNLGPTP